MEENEQDTDKPEEELPEDSPTEDHPGEDVGNEETADADEDNEDEREKVVNEETEFFSEEVIEEPPKIDQTFLGDEVAIGSDTDLISEEIKPDMEEQPQAVEGELEELEKPQDSKASVEKVSQAEGAGEVPSEEQEGKQEPLEGEEAPLEGEQEEQVEGEEKEQVEGEETEHVEGEETEHVEGEEKEQLEGEHEEQEDAEGGEESSGAAGTGTKVKIVDAPEVLNKKSLHRISARALNRRASIAYDLVPRFREEDEPRRPSGDFLLASESDSHMFYSYMDVEEEGEEEEEEVIEEEVIGIEREPYYERYAILQQEISNEKVKNFILQKKLAIYFKRKKMDHVLKESKQQVDTQVKYGRKLDTYAELVEIDSAQRNSITKELETLKEERDAQCAKLKKLFHDMQEREKEIGRGLIFTKTGNEIPEKLVERLIKRQKTQMEQVSSMRLRFIQLRDMVAEKQDAIAALDKIGEDLYLMDYEQLKVDNRSYADKIEEKEEELTRLRSKCQATIQILAHLREKSAAFETDIDDLIEDVNLVSQQHFQVREQLNSLKQERDNFRHLAEKLRNESGLLTETELLIDMDHSMTEVKVLSAELEQLKTENKTKAQQIRNIRKNIECSTEGILKKKSKMVLDKSTNQPQIYKGRPSLYKPTLPQDALDYLEDFQPHPTFEIKKTKQPLRNFHRH